jgi:hypothetical protein
METVVTPIEIDLSTLEGREILKNYYYDLTQKGKASRSAIGAIFHAKKICQKSIEFSHNGNIYKPKPVSSRRYGKKIWMESIVVPFYANNIQSMVYFGAIVLLIFVALRMLDLIGKDLSTFGMAIEALMLFFLAYILFYTPEEYFAGHEKPKGGAGLDSNLLESLKNSIDNFQKTSESLKDIVAGCQETIESVKGDKLKKEIQIELYKILDEVVNKTKDNVLQKNK